MLFRLPFHTKSATEYIDITTAHNRHKIASSNNVQKVIPSTDSLSEALSPADTGTSFVTSLCFVDSEPDFVSPVRPLLGNGLSIRSGGTTSVMLNSHSVFGNGRPSDSF